MMENELIKTSVENLYHTMIDRIIVDKFASEKCHEFYPYYTYLGFEILSSNLIKINYESDYKDFFTLEL